jgi:hypothetical protein
MRGEIADKEIPATSNPYQFATVSSFIERWRDAAEHRLANGLAPTVEIEISVLFTHLITSEIIAT